MAAKALVRVKRIQQTYLSRNFLDDLHYELLQGGHLDEAHAAQSAVVYDGTGNRIER
jgi:hypothetical protein